MLSIRPLATWVLLLAGAVVHGCAAAPGEAPGEAVEAQAERIAALDRAARELAIEDTSSYFIRLRPRPLLGHEPPEPVDPDDPVWAPPGEALYRINCGLTEQLAAEHRLEPGPWRFDRESPGPGQWGAVGGRVAFRPAEIPFHGSPYPEVLRCERFDLSGYRLPVRPGRYIVRLHFAEGFEGYTEPGRRVFDVLLNGEVVWESFDPYAAGGGVYRGSLMELRGAQPVDGALTVGFRNRVAAACLCGVEVFPQPLAQDEPENAPPTARMRTTPQTRTPVAQAQNERRRVRVLWIGNSHTFFWALPESVASLVNASQDKFWMQSYRYLHGGWSLGRFRRAEAPNALDVIREGRYDYVVLQTSAGAGAARKAQPRQHIDKAMETLDVFLEAVRASGAKPVLYLVEQPGARTPEGERQLRLRVQANAMAVIPAAAGWRALRGVEEQDDRGLVLDNDGVHIGLHTAYFNTCLHAIAWTGRPPGPVSRFVVGRELAIEPEKARFLESFAWDFWTRYDREHGPLRFVEGLPR